MFPVKQACPAGPQSYSLYFVALFGCPTSILVFVPILYFVLASPSVFCPFPRSLRRWCFLSAGLKTQISLSVPNWPQAIAYTKFAYSPTESKTRLAAELLISIAISDWHFLSSYQFDLTFWFCFCFFICQSQKWHFPFILKYSWPRFEWMSRRDFDLFSNSFEISDCVNLANLGLFRDFVDFDGCLIRSF